jgi:hypothetical protein
MEVRIVEIVLRRLVTEVFVASMDLRIMMTFAIVMTNVTTMCIMEMMTKATAMCIMEMMMRLPTTVLVVIRSRVLSRDKTTMFLNSPKKCPYETGRNAIIYGN